MEPRIVIGRAAVVYLNGDCVHAFFQCGQIRQHDRCGLLLGSSDSGVAVRSNFTALKDFRAIEVDGSGIVILQRTNKLLNIIQFTLRYGELSAVIVGGYAFLAVIAIQNGASGDIIDGLVGTKGANADIPVAVIIVGSSPVALNRGVVIQIGPDSTVIDGIVLTGHSVHLKIQPDIIAVYRFLMQLDGHGVLANVQVQVRKISYGKFIYSIIGAFFAVLNILRNVGSGATPISLDAVDVNQYGIIKTDCALERFQVSQRLRRKIQFSTEEVGRGIVLSVRAWQQGSRDLRRGDIFVDRCLALAAEGTDTDLPATIVVIRLCPVQPVIALSGRITGRVDVFALCGRCAKPRPDGKLIDLFLLAVVGSQIQMEPHVGIRRATVVHLNGNGVCARLQSIQICDYNGLRVLCTRFGSGIAVSSDFAILVDFRAVEVDHSGGVTLQNTNELLKAA